MIISCIRHGQTKMNLDELVCGRTDVDLTNVGIQQATQAAIVISQEVEKGLAPIDKVFSSPLKRAIQTAEIICKQLNQSYVIDKRLIEQDYGIFENKSRFDKKYLEIRSQFAIHFPGGESMLDLVNRVYSFLDEIKQTNQNKHVLLICHGGIQRIITTYFTNMTNTEFAEYRALNCQMQTFFL